MRISDLLKPLLALCAMVLLSICVTACGSATGGTSKAVRTASPTGTSSAASTYHAPPDSDDDDADNSTNTHYDRDDDSVLNFGHSADPSDRRQITALVKRYYAAAAAADGTKACSMLYSTFAESVPEDYGKSPPGPPFARGTTCPTVMTLIFKHFHSFLMVRLPKLKVSRVRLKERQGVAVLSFGALPEREIRLTREGHTWRVVALIDNKLP